MTSNLKRIDLDMKELEEILERARKGSLDEADVSKLKAALETLGLLTELLGDKDTTINRLRKIIFGSSSEKTSHVLGTAPGAADSDKKTEEAKHAGAQAQDGAQEEERKRQGHGRNGARDYH